MGALLQARRRAAKKSGRLVATSTYGNDPKTGYRDPGDNNRPASGIPNKYSAVAIGMDRSKLGKYVEYTPTVGKFKGQTLAVRVGDLGPAGFTGKGADVNAVFARRQGLPQGNRFPTGSKARLGKVLDKPPKGAKRIDPGLYVLSDGPKAGKVKAPKVKAPKVDVPSVGAGALPEVPEPQNSGLAAQMQQAQPMGPPSFSLPPAPWFSARRNIQSATGATEIPSQQPEPPQSGGLSDQLAQLQAQTESNPFLGPQDEFQASGKAYVDQAPGAPGVKAPKVKAAKEERLPKSGSARNNQILKTAIKRKKSPQKMGLKTGRVVKPSWSSYPIAGWIVAELEVARRMGWKGQINSGFRTRADQERIYNSGVRPAAVPGTSRHEGKDFPRGAVDVTDAAQLARILARMGSPLKWAGSKDPVHFSVPMNGSY